MDNIRNFYLLLELRKVESRLKGLKKEEARNLIKDFEYNLNNIDYYKFLLI